MSQLTTAAIGERIGEYNFRLSVHKVRIGEIGNEVNGNGSVGCHPKVETMYDAAKAAAS